VLLASLLAALAVATPPDVHPWPIGVGPRYQPAPAPAAVRRGRVVGSFGCRAREAARFGVHLELFAHRRVVIVPAGIGVAPPAIRRLGRIVRSRCSYAARTTSPTGVLEIRRGSRLTLGSFVRLWGQPLAASRLAGFRGGRVLAFVNGRRWRGDVRAIPLRRHAQIVLEIGGYVPPHPRYLFPRGL
jgi:hypothetical protein